MSVTLLATLFPKAGKADYLVSLLKEVSTYVEAKEPQTLRYQIYTETDKKTGSVKVIVLETYEDMAAVKVHGSSEPFKAFGKRIQDEGLSERPMQLQFLSKDGGFVRSKM